MTPPLRTLLIATTLLLSTLTLTTGCSSTPETEEDDSKKYLTEPPQRHVRPLQLGVPLQGVALQGRTDRHHRYYVSLPEEGLLHVRVLWHDVEGIERVVVIGAGEMKDTLVTQHAMEAIHKREAGRGQYYIELVPGNQPTSYDILVDFKPFKS